MSRTAQHVRSGLRLVTVARLLLSVVLSYAWLTACGGTPPERESPAVRLATSYTVEQSGLFAELSPHFTEQTGFRLVPAFVGSGRALERGRKQQADVVWVHSRPLEDAFVAEGYGINRVEVMASEYVLLGPKDDPAHIHHTTSAVEALQSIRTTGATFVSRGDGSGTNTRELALWHLAGLDPKDGPYVSLGAGMLAVLRKASDLGGYALSDYPTFIAHEKEVHLSVLVRGDSRLLNPYGIIVVSPLRSENVNYAGAMAFADFMIDDVTQERIARFGHQEFGTGLFQPLARPEASE